MPSDFISADRARRRAAHGFTLLELMVVVAIIAIIASISAPSMREVLVRNKVASLSNEFSAAVQQARGLAIAKNACMSLCAAKNIGLTTSAVCNSAKPADFQAGWIVFTNPACNVDATDPAADGAVLQTARNPDDATYRIQAPADAPATLMFDPRGIAAVAAGAYQVLPPAGMSDDYKRTLCFDAAGRITVRKYATSCT